MDIGFLLNGQVCMVGSCKSAVPKHRCCSLPYVAAATRHLCPWALHADAAAEIF